MTRHPVHIMRGFPPLACIQRNIRRGQPWSTVVIHGAAHDEYRPNIVGPLCLFSSTDGRAKSAVGSRLLHLPTDMVAISAPGERFTLEYEGSVEVLNLYFSDAWVRDVASGSIADSPLEEGWSGAVLPRLSPRTSIHQGLASVQNALEVGCRLGVEEAMLGVLTQMLMDNLSQWQLAERLTVKKRSTKDEVRRRLQRAVDYMHAYSGEPLALEELARIACMSKFHFVRMFKTVFEATPSRYLNQLRVQRAAWMLTFEQATVEAIADAVGFSEASALSRAFQREVGMRPGQFRSQVYNF